MPVKRHRLEKGMDNGFMKRNGNEAMSRAEELKQNKEEFLFGTICAIFHKTALRYPDKIAAADEKEKVTYRELDEYSNFLANHLISSGVKEEDIVAIQSGRHVKSLIGILATWKAGAAYVFLDDCYPEARNRSLKRECGYEIVLTEKYLEEIELRREETYIDHSKRENMAVIIYTSGTTAKPKGVVIEHRNITASISNFHRLGFCETDRLCLFPSFSFVASIYDVCGSLVVGATVEIIPEYRRRSIDLIAEFYKEKEITVAFLPPHMAMKFMKFNEDEFCLRALLVGSETVRNLEKKKYRIINVYAASETCSLASAYDITTEDINYPIGKFNENLLGYVVDEDGNLVEPGGEGELWLSGPQIVRGYFKREDITKEHFGKNPFSNEEGYERVFKTRDIVCQLEDGNFRFISRKDNMFKIRGFRVEARAVESAVLKCSEIKEVVVKAFQDKGGCNILCGYFVSDNDIDVKELKEKLKAVIPYYMIPTCFIQLDEFPRNVNNKLDRNAILPPKELMIISF